MEERVRGLEGEVEELRREMEGLRGRLREEEEKVRMIKEVIEEGV